MSAAASGRNAGSVGSVIGRRMTSASGAWQGTVPQVDHSDRHGSPGWSSGVTAAARSAAIGARTVHVGVRARHPLIGPIAKRIDLSYAKEIQLRGGSVRRTRCGPRGDAFAHLHERTPMTSNITPVGSSLERLNHLHQDAARTGGNDSEKARTALDASHMTVAERYSSDMTTAERWAGGREFAARHDASSHQEGSPVHVISSEEFLFRISASLRGEGHARAERSGSAESGDSAEPELSTRKGEGSRATPTHVLVPEGSWGEVVFDGTAAGASVGVPVLVGTRNPLAAAAVFTPPFLTSVVQNVDIEQTYVPPEPDLSGGRDSPRPNGGGSDSPPPPSQAASGSGMGPDGAVLPPSQAASGSGMGPDGAEGRGSSGSDGSQSDGPGSESSSGGASGSGGGGTSQAASGSGMGPDGASTP